MLMLLAVLFVGQCSVPKAAYAQAAAELTKAQAQSMEIFGECVCGPDGTVDWDPRPHPRGGYFAHPSCDRDGWDQRHHRYRR
jgi:hypothetical protein